MSDKEPITPEALRALVTREFILENHENVPWLSDSWLSMRTLEKDPEMLKVLDEIADLKQQIRAEGIYLQPW